VKMRMERVRRRSRKVRIKKMIRRGGPGGAEGRSRRGSVRRSRRK